MTSSCVRPWLVLSCGVLAANASAGDPPLCAAPRYDLLGNYDTEVAVGDVDGDDIADLLSVSSAVLHVARGRADGTYAPDMPSAAPMAKNLCQLGDVDGDGDLDAVTGVYAFAQGLVGLQLLLNDGDGAFTPAFTWNTGAFEPFSPLALADFDGNGMADIALVRQVTSTTSEVSIFLATGGGLFAPPTIDTLPIASRSLAAGDLDLDGDIDLALAWYDKVTPFLNQGDGSFATGPGDAVAGLPTEQSFRLVDVDGDGRLDATSSSSGWETLVIQPGLPSGGFGAPVLVALPADVSDALVADVDGDGIPDLVSAGVTEMFVQRGLGSFAFDPPASAVHLPVNLARSLAVLDANIDGRPDLLGFDTYHQAVAVLLGEADGSFLVPKRLTVEEGLQELALFDANGDGRTDLVTAHGLVSPVAMRVRLQQPDGSFTLVQSLSMATNQVLHPCLLNADAVPDVAVGFGTSVLIALGVGDGTFTKLPGSVSAGNEAVLADVTGDGKVDTIGWMKLTASLSQLTVYPGDGTGHFGVPYGIPVNSVIGDFDAGDLDGDGDLDLVIGTGISPTDPLRKWLNDGTGHFTEAAFVPPLLAPSEDLKLADVNGDGRLDLVAWPGKWCLGLPGAQFAAPLAIAGTAGGLTMRVADLDGDGASDVMWSLTDGASLRLVRGRPSGLDGPYETTSIGGDVIALAVGDIDGDGRLDVASADHEDEVPNTGEDFVTLQLQLPPGPFADLGHALAGSEGEPQLTGIGSLLAGTPASFRVTDGKPFAPATLLVGLALLQHPFKGGVLVPSPDLVLPPLPTDGFGKLVLGTTWPASLPSGLSLFLQAWLVDAAGPSGLAATNGLSATTP